MHLSDNIKEIIDSIDQYYLTANKKNMKIKNKLQILEKLLVNYE